MSAYAHHLAALNTSLLICSRLMSKRHTLLGTSQGRGEGPPGGTASGACTDCGHREHPDTRHRAVFGADAGQSTHDSSAHMEARSGCEATDHRAPALLNRGLRSVAACAQPSVPGVLPVEVARVGGMGDAAAARRRRRLSGSTEANLPAFARRRPRQVRATPPVVNASTSRLGML